MSVASAELLRAENEAKIIQTVKDMLGDKNFSDISLSEIAKNAGVAVRTISNIFGTKNCLLVMTAISAYKDELAMLDTLVASDAFAKMPGIEQVMALHYARAKHVEKNPCIVGSVSEIERQNFTTETEIDLCKKYIALAADISIYYDAPIKKGQQDGSIKKSIKTEDVPALLFFSFGSILQKLQIISLNKLIDKQVDVYSSLRTVLKITKDYLGA